MQALVANTPPAKLREALESLATPEVKKRIQIDINYLFDHPDEIVPYFTAKDADEVLLLVGSVLKGQKVDPFNLTPSQQNAIKQALETNNVDNWMARKYKKSKADRDEVRGSRGCSSSSSSSSGNSFDQRHAVACDRICKQKCR